MSWRIRQSAVAALRMSLISGGAALSWLALSAGAATADDGGEQGSLGSVAPVVESVVTPVEAVVQEVVAPPAPKPDAVTSTPSDRAINLPVVSDVVSSEPEMIADVSVVETVAPVTEAIDAGLSEAPIVKAVVPEGTTTALTQPVLAVVDSAVAPVLPPVQHVVTPVVDVIEPVVRTIDPVVEVVEPIVDPVIKPGVAVVDPLVQPVVAVVTLPDSADVVEPVSPEAVPEPVATDPKLSGDERGAAASAAPVQLNANAPSTTQDAPLPQALFVPVAAEVSAGSSSNASSYGAAQSHGAVHKLQGLPSLTSVNHQQQAGSLGITAGSANAGATGAGSAGSGSPYAADARFSFLFDLSSVGSPQSGHAAAPPMGPTFDPGSTPD